ncbi:MAG: chromosomal replication initiator DnaA [Primorskyibacter sp.]
MSQQLPFELPRRDALGRDSFFVTTSNAAALAMIETPDSWPEGRLVLTGPAGSGKSHLAHVWVAQMGARQRPAVGLRDADVPDLLHGPLCLEEAGAVAGDPAAEAALFHLLNLARARRRPVLMTHRSEPRAWGVQLPDLLSRLQASGLARLAPPDDALLSAVLAKLFADRQIVPAATVIPYLVSRMPRSFAAAAWLVADIDHRALGTRGGATRDKAQAALTALEQRPEQGSEQGPDRSKAQAGPPPRG